jgi:putative hydrolase of the HAD superfamily
MSVPIRGVLFDCVGTLLRPAPDVATVYQQVGGQFGATLDRATVKRRFQEAFQRHFSPSTPAITSQADERRRWHAVVGDVFVEQSHATAEILAVLWEHFARPAHWRLFEDVGPTWKSLRHGGYVIGIASNFDRRLYRLCASISPLDSCSHLFASVDIGFRKPDIRFFRAIERHLALAPASLLLIGDDGRNDLAGAVQAGWHALRIDRDGRSTDATGRTVATLEATIEYLNSA